MNENILNESTLPACELRLQSLRCQLETHKQTVENKKTNLNALNKVINALLRDMDVYGDDYVPKNSTSLFRKAEVDNNVFIRNFDSINGVILCAKSQIVDDIEGCIGRFGDFSYDTAILKLFAYFAYDPESPEKEDIARAYFAVRRFPGEFWEIALHRFYPLVNEGWGEYNQETKDFLFSWFAVSLRMVLRLWSKVEFSAQNIDDCKVLFNNLAFFETSKIRAIETALNPFSKKI